MQNIVVADDDLSCEFVPLPTRLTSTPLRHASGMFREVSHSYSKYSQQPASATELTHDNAIVMRKHSTRYYNSWKSTRTARSPTGETGATELEGLNSLSEFDNDSATEDSNSVLSSTSYEHLDCSRQTIHINNEKRCVSPSPAFNDCQSLVSVTPDTSSLSSPVSVSDVENSQLSDVSSLYDNEEVWCQTRLHGEVVERQQDNRTANAQDRHRHSDELELKDPEQHHTFDVKETATIRMLELELLTADLSRQMSSMHKLLRLLSSETSQLAILIDDERRRHSVRALLSAEPDRHGDELVALSSDDDEMMTSAAACERGVTQKALLSAVIEELRSVSLMMSNTLQSVTSDAATNKLHIANETDLRMAAMDRVHQLRAANSLDGQLACLSAAAATDCDEDDDDDDNKNDDTCTTEVSALCGLINSMLVWAVGVQVHIT